MCDHLNGDLKNPPAPDILSCCYDHLCEGIGGSIVGLLKSKSKVQSRVGLLRTPGHVRTKI